MKVTFLLQRSSVSRIVLTGSLKSYTIQSSVTTNEVILAPHIYNNQKGIVASRMNLTLEAVTSSTGTPQPVPNPRTVNNLIYEYNAATKEENAQNHLMEKYPQRSEPENDSANTSESSSHSSSSSSEEELQGDEQEKDLGIIRSRRSVRSRHDNSESSSSESSASSDFDSSSSSKEDFWQPKPTLTEAPKSPFMPYFISYMGNSIQASNKINVISTVEKLAKEIGEQVLDGNVITGKNTLSKFNVLVSVIQTMDAAQLQEATEKLYYPYSKVVERSKLDDQLYQTW